MNTWLIIITLAFILGLENIITGVIEYKRKYKLLAFLEFLIASLAFTLLALAIMLRW